MQPDEEPRPGSARPDESPLWLALPFVAIAAVYAVMLTGGFVWDDYFLIVSSPLVNGQAGWLDHFAQPFSNNPLLEARMFYRPLVTLSYLGDQRLWHGWAGGFHLTNILLHGAMVALLLLLCRRAGASRPVASLVVTAFALFPRLSESVAWVSGRTDVLAGVFALAALALYVPAEGRPRRAAAGAVLFLGLLSKEVAVAAALALVISAWLRAKPRSIRQVVVDVFAVAMAVAAYVLLRLRAMSSVQEVVPSRGRSPAAVVTLALDALARYTWMIVDPLQPSVQIGDSESPSAAWAVAGALVCLAAVAAVVRWRQRISQQQWIAIGLGGASLAVVLHVFPLNVVAADRFLYLPLAALAIAVAGPVERLWQRHRRVVLLAGAAVIATFAVTSAARARTWTDEVRLWRDAVARSSPGQPQPRIELASALMRRNRFAEALGTLAGVRESGAALAAVNLATCLDKLGRRADAVRAIESLLRVQPWRTSARINLMLLYARDGRYEAARRAGERLLADFPDRIDLPPLVSKLGQVMGEMESLPAASGAEPLEQRVRRASLYDQLGALPEAQSLWRAIALDPTAAPEARIRGASYLALFGDPEVARQTLDRLASERFAPAQLPALKAAYDSRFD